MARSQQSFIKNQKEKMRLKKREDKRRKMEARKAQKEPGQGIEFAYVDHDGNLTDTPPDPSMKVEFDLESIPIGVTKREKVKEDPVRNGKVSFFDSSRGFGFIIDTENQQKYFTHVSGLLDTIAEDDEVSFELERGPKGMNAVRVKII